MLLFHPTVFDPFLQHPGCCRYPTRTPDPPDRAREPRTAFRCPGHGANIQDQSNYGKAGRSLSGG